MSDNKTYIGFKPYSYQRAVIDELCSEEVFGKKKIVVTKSQRQRGKTMMNANILLYYAINFKRSKNFYIAPTIKQSKEIYKAIVSAISSSGIIKTSNASDLIIKLINGSTINFKSGQQKENLRGYTCNGILIIDEAAYLADEIFSIILPWCDWWKSNILMTSTPFVKAGFYYNYYNYGLMKTNNTVTVDWCDERFKEDMLKVMSEEQLEEYRKLLPNNVFRMDYLGEFLDDDGTVFTHYKECINHNYIKPTDKLYLGIDWATGDGNDDTAVSVLNQEGKQVLLAYNNSISPTEQIKWLENLFRPYMKQIVTIRTELNSIGTPMTDFLKNKSQFSVIKHKFDGFITSNSSKNDIVKQLQVAFEQNLIEILPDDNQITELGFYSAEYNMKTKNISYNAPKGLKDDICICLMLSYDAYRTNNVKGKYVLR